MKKFVGISSILLLSSVLANTGVSLASAAETKEEAKMVDTTKEKNEKKYSSDDSSDSSTKEKNARDIASTSTEESSAIEEVDGAAMLQDPAKDLLDKITESTKEENSEEKSSKEDKEKGDKKSEEAKTLIEKSKPEGLLGGIKHPLDDWIWKLETVSGKTVVTLKSLKNPNATHVDVPAIYNISSTGELKPCYLSKDAFKGNKYIQSVTFLKPSYEVDISPRLYNPRTMQETTDGSYLFSDMPKLTSVDFTGIRISEITNFSYMFSEDISLTNLTGISTLNTSSGVNFVGMFKGCKGLKSIDLSEWQLDRAQDMSAMFMDCRKLTEIKIHNLPNRVNMAAMFENAPIVYAELLFSSSRALAGTISNMFYLDPNQFNNLYLPLLIYSNSQTFLNTKSGELKNQYYTYTEFAEDGRTIPFMLDSGEGLFKQTKNPPYFTQFDINKVHNHEEKLCMIQGITNGFATNMNPIRQLSNAQSTIQKVIKDVNPYPTILDDKMPPKEDKSRFYANYYTDDTKKRMNGWHPIFDSAPEYQKAIFTKVTAQYAPVNPEMEKGHVVDSKNPNSKTWPENRIPQSPLGFAYQPDTLTAEMELGEIGQPLSGKLDVPNRKKSAQDDGLFHIGVRDYTRRDNNNGVGPKWTVNAQYRVTNPMFKGSYIGFDQNIVKFNLNNYKNITNKPVLFQVSQLTNSFKQGDKTVSLHGVSSSPYTKQLIDGRTVRLMTSNGSQVQQFYDLNLGNLTLNLPKDNGFQPTKDPTTVGQIDWNLTTGPNGN